MYPPIVSECSWKVKRNVIIYTALTDYFARTSYHSFWSMILHTYSIFIPYSIDSFVCRWWLHFYNSWKKKSYFPVTCTCTECTEFPLWKLIHKLGSGHSPVVISLYGEWEEFRSCCFDTFTVFCCQSVWKRFETVSLKWKEDYWLLIKGDHFSEKNTN